MIIIMIIIIVGWWSCTSSLCPLLKVYTVHKTGAEQGDVTCRLCGKSPEVLVQVVVGWSALAQSKYLERHNAALKVLFFEITRDVRLIDSVPPWYSCAVPKPVYESSEVLAFLGCSSLCGTHHRQC